VSIFDKLFGRRSQEDNPASDVEQIGLDMGKVLPFPELKAAPEPIKLPEDISGKTCYSIGLTDNNRVSLIVGYSTVTMNSVGVANLIAQLELTKSLIEESEGSD
jgi:hypothetical protein